MTVTVSSKGQIVLPAALRQRDRIRHGQTFDVERISRGKYRLVLRRPWSDGAIDWLLTCPVRGYFTPISTDPTARINGR